jgi:calcium-dependent protein kinase
VFKMGCSNSVEMALQRHAIYKDGFHGKYVVGERLGEGNFGQVRVATLRMPKSAGQATSKTNRAVKIIDLRSSSKERRCGVDSQKVEDAEAEAQVMRLLEGHKHCVQIFEIFIEKAMFYMVMEKCEASLVDSLDRMKFASEDYVAHLFRDMLSGISHMHEVNLVHRDVKPDNFLLGGVDGETVKLADFGMTVKMPKRGYVTSHCGTAPYMSPEVVARKKYDFKTDVWSMGVSAYVLLYGEFPYVPKSFTPQEMKQQILIGEPLPQYVPAEADASVPSDCAESFVRSLLERDQADRCTAKAALQLPFLCSGGLPADQVQDITPTFRRARLTTRTKWDDDDSAVQDDLNAFLMGCPSELLPISRKQPQGTDSTPSLTSSEAGAPPSCDETCSRESCDEPLAFTVRL